MISRRTIMIALSRFRKTLSLQNGIREFRAASVHSPSNLPVHRTLNLRGCGVNEVWNEFQVAIIEQILAADRELHARRRFPAQVHVERVIAWDVQPRQTTDVAHNEVVFKVPAKVQRRS